MADRNYIIEILLKARDDTARAFATAAGNVEAYDKLIEEQQAHFEGASAAQDKATESTKKYTTATKQQTQAEKDLSSAYRTKVKGTAEVARNIQALERAQRNVNKAENEGIGTSADLRVSKAQLEQAESKLTDTIVKQEGIERKNAQVRVERISKVVQERQATERLMASREASARQEEQITRRQQQLISRADRPAQLLASPNTSIPQETRATRELLSIREQLQRSGMQGIEIDKQIGVVRRQALRDYGFASQAERDEVKRVNDIIYARKKLEAVRKQGGIADPLTVQTAAQKLPTDNILGSISDGFGKAAENVTELQSGVSGFAKLMPLAIGPAITLISGLVGAFAALGSAAVAAGAAVYTSFISALSQGIPVIALFGAAMSRLSQIVGYVSAQHQQLEQRFIAAYETAQQTKMGINQVAIAEHNLSDTQFSASQAAFNLRVAQLGLLATRQQAARQLQDLIFQEDQARLAAEASSLAVTDAQKALRQAVATGGDVASAQLQLQSAQVGHQQAVVQAQRAVADASKGSIVRQQITQQVAEAQNAVVGAQRAIVDSQYAIREANAAIIQAKQAAAGYNVGVAAQLAFLRSQMTSTEKSLAGNISRIYSMFQGVHGKLRPVTDAILSAFIPLTGGIIKLFNNPKYFAALLNLGKQIGAAFRIIGNTIFSNDAVKSYIKLIDAAAANAAPFARLISGFLKSVGSIATAAIPFVHQFLLFMTGIVTQFANWASSTKGQNWLADFFKTAFKSLEAFIRLGESIAKLIFAVIGTGGGAKEGISLIDQLTQKVNALTDSINSHGTAFNTLKTLWKSVGPILHDLGIAFGAVIKGIFEIATSPSGQQSLQAFATFIKNVLVPGFVEFVKILGVFTKEVLNFFNAHPEIEHVVTTIFAGGLAMKVMVNAAKVLLGPLGTIFKLFSGIFGAAEKAWGFAQKMKGFLTGQKGGLDPMQQAANKNAEAAGVMDKAADKMGAAADKMGTAAEGQDTAAGTQETAAGTQETAAATQETAAGTQEVAATEQVTAGGEGLAGGGLAAGGEGVGLAGLGGGALGALGAAGPVGLIMAGILYGGLQKSPYQSDKGSSAISRAQTGPQLESLIRKYRTESAAPPPPNTGQYRGGGGAASIRQEQWATRSNTAMTGAREYVSRFIPSAQQVSLANSSVSALNKLRQRAQELLKLPDLTNKMRGSLASLVVSLSKTSIEVAQAAHRWGQTFSGLDITVPHLVNHIKDQLKTDQDTIASNFKKGTEGWTTNMIGLIQSAANKLKPLAAQGVKGARAELDKLNGELLKLYGHFQAEFKKVNDLIKREAPLVLRNSLLGITKGVEQGIGIIGGVNFKATGGPIGSGYGGGDRYPIMAEAGEHIFTKEEVSNAGGHGAMYAMRRMLGGGGQGGPRGYAQGGQIGNTQTSMAQFLAQSGGQTTQGVEGPLGSVLSNLLSFNKAFIRDWGNLWSQLDDLTKNNVQTQEDQFTNLLNMIKNTWSSINSNTQTQLQTLTTSIKNALTAMDHAIKNAFQYVADSTNKALKAFGAKPVQIQLGDIPSFESGGYVGQRGERGPDAVHTVLGRGEAVLNYAHQNFVEPAMRAFYGWGLGDMFSKVRGKHGQESSGGMAGGGFTGGGGYVNPVPGWAPSRIDQGVDGTLSSAGYIAPADSRVIMADAYNAGWRGGWISAQITDGPYRGRIYYTAEGVRPASGIRSGSFIRAGQKLGVPQASGYNGIVGNIETGWANSAGSSTLAQSLPGYSGDQSVAAITAGESFNAFILSLGGAGGHVDPGGAQADPSLLKHYPTPAVGKGGVMAMWNAIKKVAVHGTGAMAAIAQKAIGKVTDAANQYGQSKAGFAGGQGSHAVKALPGGWFRVGATIDPTQGQAPTYSDHSGFSFAELLVAGANAGMRAQDLSATIGARNGQYGMPMESPLWVRMPGANHMFKMWKNDVGSGQAGDPFYKVDLHQAIANALHWIPNQAIEVKKAFARGGIVDDGSGEGKPIPITAHVGEWILNKTQQMKAAMMAGTSVEGLKKKLGFTGGPTHFKGGGEAGPGGIPGDLYPKVSKTGIFPFSPIALDVPDFYNRIIATFLGEGRLIVNKIETNGKKLLKGIGDFVQNMQQATGDGGIFALAAQAVSDFVTKLQTGLGLATEGVREVNNKLVYGVIPTALGVANLTIGSLRKQGKALEKLRSEENDALGQVQKQIKALEKGGISKSERSAYEQLLGVRQNIINSLGQLDQSIQQNLQDRFDAATAAFQARIDQYMRSGGVLDPTGKKGAAENRAAGKFTLSAGQLKAAEAISASGESIRQFVEDRHPDMGNKAVTKRVKELRGALSKIGPSIAAGIAAMNQTIAQTLGNSSKEITADSSVLNAAVSTRNALKQAYEAAAKKAEKDPRWQKIADDLLNQLETATSSVVQAQAQELQDRITKADTKATMQNAFIQMRNSVVTAQIALGNLGPLAGIRQQVGVSQANQAALGGQLQHYQELLHRAEQEHNTQAVHDLTQKVEDLKGQVAGAEVATQQLITSLHQTATTIAQTQAQTNSGFLQSAQSIVQTLGQTASALKLLNIPQQIAIARRTAQVLGGGARQIDRVVGNTINSPNALGNFAAQGDPLLTKLLGAFDKGPQAFASALTRLGPSLARLEAKVPPDVAQLIQSSVQAMIDNTTAVVTNNQALQTLATSLHQTALAIVNTQAQTSGGFLSSASGIVQTLGQITGSLNLPQLISIAKETAQNLQAGAKQIDKTIKDTINDPNSFGQFQNQANALLAPLMNAFNQGPQAFAMELANLGPSLAALESKMPPDVASLFQNLIQSMIDNTSATATNSQQLQQLNATTNQQQFSSSAWTMFRQAIFNGLGGLLPQYAMAVPSMDVGGLITDNGLLYGHKGEVVVPAAVSKGEFPSGGNNENHFHITEPMEVADPVHLGNAIAFRLNHDPNSR